ncbi:hypothetical protein LguiB_012512 [Lonicera macranthoides]
MVQTQLPLLPESIITQIIFANLCESKKTQVAFKEIGKETQFLFTYHVEATRVLPEELAGANHFSTLPSEYKMKAKYMMSYWFGMLASGPSPKGPGH